MKNDRNTDIDISLIGLYVKGDTTPEQEREILLWLEKSEENVRFFTEVASNISVHAGMSDSALKDTEVMVSRLNARIDASAGAAAECKSGHSWRNSLSHSRDRAGAALVGVISAAAVAAVAVVLILNQFRTPSPESDSKSQYATVCANTSAATKCIVLPDETMVFLKPGSEIRYDVSSLADRRILEITGEAYFDVAADSLRPFTVKTRDISVSVLGTAFTVSSRPGNPLTEVMLERGSVRLLSPQGTPLLKLAPNQKASYCSEDGDVTVEERPAYADIAAEYRIISLEEVTLTQITESIGSIFGVRVTPASGSPYQRQSKKYFFKYLRTDSLQDVVSAAEHLTGAKLKVER